MSDVRAPTIRRAILLFAPFAAIALCVTYLLYASQATAIRAGAEATERRLLENAQQSFTQTLIVILSDLIYVANQDALATWLAAGDRGALKHLQSEHLAFARSRGFYDQIRLLDATGRETLRLEWNSGSPEIAPEGRLATARIDLAFQQAMTLERGQLYVTELARGDPLSTGEAGEPALSIAAPVFDRTGQKRGVVVLKYRAQRLIDRVRALGTEVSQIWLVDGAGNWVIGPSADGGAAADSDVAADEAAKTSFAAAYPIAWAQITGGGAATAMMSAPQGRFAYGRITAEDYRPLAVAQTVRVPAITGPTWIGVVHTPAAAIWAQTSELRRYVGLAAGVLLLLLAVAAWGLARQQLQRKDSEQRIRASEARFRDLLESAPDAIIIIDGSGGIELVNAQVERLFGYPRNELIGQSIDTLVPERMRERHTSQRKAYLAAAHSRQLGAGLDLRGLRKDGSEFPISLSLSPTRTGNSLSVFCGIRDISAQREAERKIQDLNRRLLQDNAELEGLNRELETFSYSVSHDLQAPLRTIAGFSQALQDDAGHKLDAGGRSHLERVRQAAQRMELLIEDLLKLASVSRTDMSKSTVDVSSLASEILSDLAAVEPHRAAQADIAPGLRASADPRLLRIALENLLSNAWKFTMPSPTAAISVGQEMTDSGLAFFVRDNGVGFDMAKAGRLFRPFHRLHEGRQFPGTGIGLATAQRVIRRHGGEVWARSQPGEGTVFYFTLR